VYILEDINSRAVSLEKGYNLMMTCLVVLTENSIRLDEAHAMLVEISTGSLRASTLQT
jgi:hypothetical protein